MSDDRYDVTPEKCCWNCKHLHSDVLGWAWQCLRDDPDLPTYECEYGSEDEKDAIRLRCPQWKAEGVS